MPTPWDDYLSPGNAQAQFKACHTVCAPSFHRQRTALQHAFEAVRPRTVACLGAGMLNDIPYDSFVRDGAVVHLVDWLPGITQAGLTHTILSADADGSPICLYCSLPENSAQDFCCNHCDKRGGAKVCDNFAPAPEGRPAASHSRKVPCPISTART